MKSLRHLRLAAPAAIAAVCALSFLGSTAPARAEVNVYFHVGVPAAPLHVVYAEPEPEVVVIPNSQVYVVRGSDYDVYRYGGMYYAYDNGYWYRARSYEGPWVGVRVVSVPRQVLYVPASYRPHWVEVAPAYRVPPGQMRKYYKHEYKEERRDDRAERRYYKHHHGD